MSKIASYNQSLSSDHVRGDNTTPVLTDYSVGMDFQQATGSPPTTQSLHARESSELVKSVPQHIEKLTAVQFFKNAVTGPAEAAQTQGTITNDDAIPNEVIPIVPPMRYNMLYDDSNFGDGQVVLKDPLSFGTLNMVFGRISADGMPAMTLKLPDLDQLLILINQKLTTGQEKIRSLYTSAVSKVIKSKDPNFGKPEGRIVLTPDACALLDNLRDEDERFSLKWTFKKSLGTDIVKPMIFSEISLVFASDRKTVVGTIAEYDSRSANLQGRL